MNFAIMPELSEIEMYERVLASDAAWDGRFYFGVVTTGVYCLPSCRVRKPLRQNVRFFTSPQAAREAGLRPCRRCHPDDLSERDDIERDEVLALLAEVRATPERFPDVAAIIGRSGYGPTRVFESFRRVLGTTPAHALHEARLDLARRLLRETDESALSIALASGYRSVSAFHRRFRLSTGMTPLAYRTIERAS